MAKYTSENVGKCVTRQSFAAVFRDAFDQTVKVTTIVNSFRDSGIYPVNFGAIRSSKIMPSSVYSSDKPSAKPDTQDIATQPKMTLESLEKMMSAETIRTFETRYEEKI